jgi:hypothetical protein
LASHRFPLNQHRPGRPPSHAQKLGQQQQLTAGHNFEPGHLSEKGRHVAARPPTSRAVRRRPARAGRPPPRAQSSIPAAATDSGPHCLGSHLSGTCALPPLTRAPLHRPRARALRRCGGLPSATHQVTDSGPHRMGGATCQGPVAPLHRPARLTRG